MRKYFLSLLYSIFPFYSTLGNSSNPPNGYHGESQNCAECHSGNLNNGDGTITLTGLPSSYTLGKTYDLALTVSGSNSRGYGFQLMPKANGSVSGNLTAVSSGMAIESGAAEHRGTSSTGIWNFQWTAPSTNEGTIFFYATGLATSGNSGNSGDYVYTLSQNLSANSFIHASMDWNASTEGVIFSSPAVAQDGSIYIGSNDNKLYAFNSDGSSKWSFETGNWVDSTPAIASDGTIYVGSWDNKVYALNPDNGTKIWEHETNSYVVSSPAIGADGRIYIGSKDSIFYAFESNGSVAWEYFAGQPISASAALGQDGTIYFGDENGTLHAVNPDGSSKWKYVVDDVTDTNKSILSSPALDLSGNIYFGSGNGYCYSIADNENNASLNWSFLTSDRVDASPVLGINDEVFFVSRDGYLRSLSTFSGNLNWDALVGDVFYSSPVVDENGRTYVIGYTGGGENHLFAFDSDGTKAWDTNDTDCPFEIGGIVDTSLALSSDGKLYYGCYDNRIYCIDVGVSPASSDWPMFQRSGRRDGAWPSYLLETLVSPIGVASISGAGIYNEGATASITVSSISEGYSFSQWTGGASGSDNPLNITINSSTSVTANFSLNQYSLSVNAGTGGNVTGSGTFDHGTNANITATAQTGYYFSGWSGQGIADLTSASTTVSMTEARTITASFAPLTFSISASVNPSGTGQVTGSGNYQFGEEANLAAATTMNGYSFLSWSGDINSTENPLILNIDSNLSLTANFSLNTYSLEISAGIGGTVSGNGNFAHGSLAEINATPDVGYSFSSWTGEGIGNSTAVSTTVEMSQDKTISAIFTLNQYSLTLLKGSGGTVSGEGNFSHGTLADISATPDTGYSFSGWEGDGVADTNSPNTTVEMTGLRIVSASFSQNQYTLLVLSGNGGTVTGEGNYSHGEITPINAVPDTGYFFTGWSGDGVVDASSSNTSVEMTEPRIVSASFSPNQYALNVLSGNGGAVTGEGNFSHGEITPINAIPNSGFVFSHWDGPSIFDSNSPSTFVEVNQSIEVTAHFTEKPDDSIVLVASADPIEGGITQGSGSYETGSVVNISAIASPGYSFDRWIGEGIENSNEANTSITITDEINISAVFTHLEYDLLLYSTTGGTVEGNGTFAHGTSTPILATPSIGYTFKYWLGEGVDDPSRVNPSVSITEDRNLTAIFEIKKYQLNLTAEEGGSVSGSGSFLHGTEALISAEENIGYTFIGWVGEGIVNSSVRETTILMTQDFNVSAQFQRNQYSLSVFAGDGGSVNGAGTYPFGTKAFISATPDEGFSFSQWSGKNIENPLDQNTTITISENGFVFGIFSHNSHELSIHTSGLGSVSGAGIYEYGHMETISAIPATGQFFSKWIGDGISDPLEANTSILMTEDRNISAIFLPYEHSLSVYSSEGGQATGTGSFEFGTQTSISATPSIGHYFSKWTGDGISDPLEANTSILMTEDRNISASFLPYTHSLSVYASEGGQATGSGSFEFGTQASISATPSFGYSFSHWTGNGVIQSNEITTFVLVSEDQNITANFIPIEPSSYLAVEEITENWYSSWLGIHFETTSGWSYHLELGWIYPVMAKEDSIWIWSDDFKWLWTDKQNRGQSMYWSENDQNWLFFNASNPTNRKYYSYLLEQWIEF